jgi:hypothetical protein
MFCQNPNPAMDILSPPSVSSPAAFPGKESPHLFRIKGGLDFFFAALLCVLGAGLAHAKTYHLSPTGNDSNSGISASAPWLSPNHPLNCGDLIVAEPSTGYSAANFYTGKWGKVSCPAKNKVAWLECATFDACKISTTAAQGMWVDQSYWGVQGWEVTTSASDKYGTCFMAQPNWASPAQIHHIIFANDIANGCAQAGFAAANHGSAGVDYFAVVGSIAYNATQGSTTCTSGISIYQPIQSDSLPGTHIYVAGNFSYANVDSSKCNGGPPTDGDGITLDSFDGSRDHIPHPYSAQVVVENNIVVGNGGKGIEVSNNSAGSSHSAIYIKHNTSWGNLTDPHQSWLGCGEVLLNVTKTTQVSGNLISTKSATGCGGHPIYALAISRCDETVSITGNLAYGYNGNNAFRYQDGSVGWDSNKLGQDPNFTKPVVPGAPTCTGTSNVRNCMAPVISDFRPKRLQHQSWAIRKPVPHPSRTRSSRGGYAPQVYPPD